MADDPMRMRPSAPKPRSQPTPPMRQWIDEGVGKLQAFHEEQVQPPPEPGPSNTERLRSARSQREADALAQRGAGLESQSREPGAAAAFTRSFEGNRAEQRQLTRQEEARAAIAMMRQQEGKPLSPEDKAVLQMQGLFGAADRLRAEAGAGYKAVTRANPMHGPVNQWIGATAGAQRDVRQGQVAQYEAGLQSAQDIEAFQARVSLEDDMVQAGLQAKELNRAAQMDEAQQAVKEASRLVQNAAEQFNRTPGIDPNRLWANKTAGQKFGAAILSIVGARAGAVLPGSFQAIQQSIADDIQAQKDNIALGQAKFGALSSAFQSQTSAYAAIRDAVSDERTADLVYERARLEQAEREFAYWQQKGQVAQLSAGQQAFLGQIQQTKADLDLQLQQRAVNNPRSFTKVVSTMRPWERQAKLKRAEKLDELGIDLAKEGQKQSGEMEKERFKAGVAAGEGPSAAERSLTFEQRKYIDKESRPYRTELELIRKFQEKYPNNIPGVGAFGETGGAIGGAAAGFTTGFVPGAIIGGIVGANSGELTAEQRDARAALTRIVMVRLRRESGAAIGEGELYRDAKRIVDGWTDEDVNRELSARAEEASANIDLIERAPEEGEVQQYRRAPVQERRAITEQSGVADPTVVDEEAIPYANPR